MSQEILLQVVLQQDVDDGQGWPTFFGLNANTVILPTLLLPFANFDCHFVRWCTT